MKRAVWTFQTARAVTIVTLDHPNFYAHELKVRNKNDEEYKLKCQIMEIHRTHDMSRISRIRVAEIKRATKTTTLFFVVAKIFFISSWLDKDGARSFALTSGFFDLTAAWHHLTWHIARSIYFRLARLIKRCQQIAKCKMNLSYLGPVQTPIFMSRT